MVIQFRNLVFEGGGVKTIAYIGAMTVLEQRGILRNIIRIGGASAGAINALIFALGYDLTEQRQILASTDFKKFKDHSFGLIMDIRRLAKDFGWYKGDFFSNWIGTLIKEKLGRRDATFKDLAKTDAPALYIVGTNLTTGFAEVFSDEHTSNMPLATAVRISMSIPLFFAAVLHGPRRDVYVDGGVSQNYPIKLFDRERYIDMVNEPYAARETEYYKSENVRFLKIMPGRSPYVYNRQTLGFRLASQDEVAVFRYNEPPKERPIKNFTDYARALINTITYVQQNQHLHEDDWHRTLFIDTYDMRATEFNLTDEKKKELIHSGINSADKYFCWFDNLDELPCNRI